MKATGISVLVHHFPSDFFMLVGDDTLGAGQKADQLAVGMRPFGGLKDSSDDIMPSRGGTSGKDDTNTPGKFLPGLASIRDDFHQFILAHKGQLFNGHFEHFQIKPRQRTG